MQKKYIDFTEEQLLQDPYFIKWVKHHKGKDDAFWNELMASNPPNLKEIESAALKLTIILSADKNDTSVISKDEVWNSVSASIYSSGSNIQPVIYKWLAAASVVVLLTFLGIYINSNSNTIEQTANTEVEKVQDVAPGGNKAILQLADGSTIILDSTGNGNIASQGQTKIMKIDGQLAYNAFGASTEMLYNTISTPRGGQYQLVLADGSKVWLNAASSIRFPAAFTGKERNVEITGEVYFEVAHNEKKPFTVKAGSMAVQVLGTHFNVNAYEDEGVIKTTLLEGSVKVNSAGQSAILRPGQQALLQPENSQLTTVDHVDVDKAVAWKNGYFYFDNSTIEDIGRQVSRWYDVTFTYEGKIPAGHFMGKPSRDLSLSKLLKIIELSGVNLKIKDKNVIVSE